MNMKDLKRTEADKAVEKERHRAMGWGDPPEPHDYPMGAQINLGEGELEKLGITDLPKVGTEMTFVGRAKVVTAHSEAGKNSQLTETVQLQITHLGLQRSATKPMAERMYGAKDK